MEYKNYSYIMKGSSGNNLNSNRIRTKSFNAKFDGPVLGNSGNGTQRLNHNFPTSASGAGPAMDSYKYSFYAGAKFDTIPLLTDLPVPPSHWTGDSNGSSGRSQSTPSSPITISNPLQDKHSSGNIGLFKSASLPGESSTTVFRAPNSHSNQFRKPRAQPKQAKQQNQHKKLARSQQQVQRQPPKKQEISGNDLMGMLLKNNTVMTALNSQALGSNISTRTDQYKEITDNLKSLLKVSA